MIEFLCLYDDGSVWWGSALAGVFWRFIQALSELVFTSYPVFTFYPSRLPVNDSGYSAQKLVYKLDVVVGSPWQPNKLNSSFNVPPFSIKKHPMFYAHSQLPLHILVAVVPWYCCPWQPYLKAVAYSLWIPSPTTASLIGLKLGSCLVLEQVPAALNGAAYMYTNVPCSICSLTWARLSKIP